MRGRPRSLVRGVGINDIDGSPYLRDSDNKIIHTYPFYAKWCSLLDRLYIYSHTERGKAYKGCTLCEDWLYFSKFKSWMENQDWIGKEIDKDILGGGKLYSPETCIFILPMTNKFLIDKSRYHGDYMQGVYLPKKSNKYVGQYSSPFSNKRITKVFEKEIDAHIFYLKGKISVGDRLAELETDPRVKRYLQTFFRSKLLYVQNKYEDEL